MLSSMKDSVKDSVTELLEKTKCIELCRDHLAEILRKDSFNVFFPHFFLAKHKVMPDITCFKKHGPLCTQ